MARNGATRGADIKAMGALLGLKTSANVQVAIVSRLGKLPGKEVPTVLLSGWKDYTPSIRAEVLNVLTARPDWMGILLDAVEKGQVAKIDVDAGTRQLFMINRGHRPRAMKLFTAASTTDRGKILKKYRPALKLKGDIARGKLVFHKVCIACHKVGDIGLEIGPNLASVTDRRPESMLSAILDPNAAVEGKYSSYIANTKDGRAILGILISETGANITIKDQANQEHVILRSELVSLANTGRSLMPDGLEAGFNQQELADLIAFVVAAK
jgi:putative heme-binding domain-containing protein